MTAALEIFKLTDSERNSHVWGRLRAHFKDKLQYWRAQNDGKDTDAATTAFIRGQIATYKTLIKLDDEPQKPNP